MTNLVQHAELPDGLMSWIMAGACLSLAGLATIKSRHGALRSFLEANIMLLRAWMLCAAIGSFLSGLCLGRSPRAVSAEHY